LVAIELAAWLNDVQIILQAVVQCYGLIAPLIYYNIEYEPIVQVIIKYQFKNKDFFVILTIHLDFIDLFSNIGRFTNFIVSA